MATLAKDLKPRGIGVLVFCPGWVQTEMGGSNAPHGVTESVAGIRSLIDRAPDAGAARFQGFDGTPLAW
jgi:NAD(P)-dependent dehydrogenase (short-subunit alcohol dehydrogenase family)